MKHALVTIVIAVLLFQCKGERPQPEAPKIMTGWLTEKYLLTQLPEYKKNKDEYQPDTKIIAQLDSLKDTFETLVFLGTYCPDCKREVPRFLKVVDLLKNQRIGYRLFGLNRARLDTSGMRQKYNIEYIPTFIVYHNGKEIGRIVESTMVSMEHDLLEICTNF